MSSVNPNSINKEASRAFKKVKYDIEELRKQLNTKQDRQQNVFTEMNNMKSELRIEFREELLELQKTMSKEIDSLRKEVLYYRKQCENNRFDHHKIKVVQHSDSLDSSPINSNTKHTTNENEFTYKRIVKDNTTNYQPTPPTQDFGEEEFKKKSYLKWITVGDADLDSIDEVYVK